MSMTKQGRLEGLLNGPLVAGPDQQRTKPSPYPKRVGRKRQADSRCLDMVQG
jgi:hypothetical protein